MADQYEVEHGIKKDEAPRRRRQIDMASFNSQLRTLTSEPSSTEQRTNPHATPTPVDMANLARLLQEQLSTLARDAPSPENRDLLALLHDALEGDVANPPRDVAGVSQEFLDRLDRVPKAALGDDACPICAERFLDDPYPLVVELQCHRSHRFDLDCVGPWLQVKGSCPLCRTDLTKYDPRQKKGASGRIKKLWAAEDKKQDAQDYEDDDPDMLYG